jgi:GxxExxY protein
MGLTATSTASRPTSPEIFSQRDREIGRFSGFETRLVETLATRASGARLGEMPHDDFSLSEQVIGACIEVHRLLGAGLLESIYEECLCRELTVRGMNFERQKAISIKYKGDLLDQGYRMDLVVEKALLVEIKAVDALLPIHAAQVVTYLRVADLPSGLLVNFNALTIRD